MFLRSVTPTAARISIARELELPVVGYLAGSQGTALFTPLQARDSDDDRVEDANLARRIAKPRGDAKARPNGPAYRDVVNHDTLRTVANPKTVRFEWQVSHSHANMLHDDVVGLDGRPPVRESEFLAMARSGLRLLYRDS